ncbi:hypothetical protein CgunFtcFv8_020122 [Champsocephalus gunnari]|uniref:Uncharacterized protein n=1 Tax=Champsocephalus gunnari TaxID=52237 RepID=A0AAN8DJ67_CHAGU|nr:hypothetical protein CgunFtcFv8_020122 [Champsocephalus gunnari]
MSSDGSSVSRCKPPPPLMHCYQTIRARPLLRTPKKTFAEELNSDTFASHTHNKLQSQAARLSMQKIGIAHTVNFNQSPRCVFLLPAPCLVFL